jgi:hypothetical protein
VHKIKDQKEFRVYNSEPQENSQTSGHPLSLFLCDCLGKINSRRVPDIYIFILETFFPEQSQSSTNDCLLFFVKQQILLQWLCTIHVCIIYHFHNPQKT